VRAVALFIKIKIHFAEKYSYRLEGRRWTQSTIKWNKFYFSRTREIVACQQSSLVTRRSHEYSRRSLIFAPKCGNWPKTRERVKWVFRKYGCFVGLNIYLPVWKQSIEFGGHCGSHSRKQATTLRPGPTSCSTAPKCNPVACGRLYLRSAVLQLQFSGYILHKWICNAFYYGANCELNCF